MNQIIINEYSIAVLPNWLRFESGIWHRFYFFSAIANICMDLLRSRMLHLNGLERGSWNNIQPIKLASLHVYFDSSMMVIIHKRYIKDMQRISYIHHTYSHLEPYIFGMRQVELVRNQRVDCLPLLRLRQQKIRTPLFACLCYEIKKKRHWFDLIWSENRDVHSSWQ